MANIVVTDVSIVNALERAGFATTESNVRRIRKALPSTTAALLDSLVASVDLPCKAVAEALF
ncbi:hypothetical protein [Bifidobacterium eulemuris]|uniref:Uncharacterized protein n=1 Tax=Bifidobacterium eulemuris TaxID=1765219 RepID=A0A261GAQ0_9BIFI|nr:hypothetical protein [Bifidobacterium eulemuris]OZG68255.1 hypothetical protein BEUL_1268 [Bifidobacterium eulemuris]QOL31689.1 hypothetical protein BE0216_03850 [Bifidobacterium eulemuris]